MARKVTEYQRTGGRVSSGVMPVNFSEMSARSPLAGRSFTQAADLVSKISSRMEDRADIQAATEATRAGRMAGQNGVPQLQDEATIKGAAFNQSARDAVRTEFDLKGRLKLDEFEDQYQNDPVGFNSAVAGFSDGHLAALREQGYEDIAQDIEGSLDINSRNAMRRIEGRAEAIARDRQVESALQFQMQAQRDLIKSSRMLLDADASEIPDILGQMTDVSLRAADVGEQFGPDGKPLFTATQRVSFGSKMKDMVAEQVGIAWLQKQPDFESAVDAWQKGEAFIEVLDEDGEASKIRLEDALGLDASQNALPYMEKAARSLISEANAAIEKRSTEVVSTIDLAVETAGDFKTLEDLGRQVDVYEETIGLPKANNLRKKIFKAQEDYRKDNELLADGALFARGDAFFNPEDAGHKKAFNKFFEVAQNEIVQLEPAQRNMSIAKIVGNARAVPDLLKGNIKQAARSRDPQVVAQAADLMDRIADQNPHLLNDLGSEKDIVRIRMVNDRINAGYDEKEAFNMVEQQLDPRNAPATEQVNAEIKAVLKDQKIDFRGKAADALSQFGEGSLDFLPFVDESLSRGDVAAMGQLDLAGTHYRIAWEDAYRMTRDEGQADQMAADKVKGMFGRSEINGRTQVMQFAPEKYYSINGLSEAENARWMRDQMIDDVVKITSNDFSPPTRKDLKENLRILPVPSVTARTAEKGQPVYQLVLIKDGVPVPVMDEYYIFDPAAARQKLIDDAQNDDGGSYNFLPTGARN